MLEVRLFGEQRVTEPRVSDLQIREPRAEGDERAPSSRAIALLGYLVLHAGAAVSRQQLAGVFWPESTEPQARTNLRRELHLLRVIVAADPSLVVSAATLAWVDQPSCRVDVRTFVVARAAALADLAEGDRAAFLGHAATAIEAYRGDLMPGLYDDWALDHRERLRQACVDLCEAAAAAWREAGDTAHAIDVARRRVQLDPLGEAGYRALMELQADSGDRAGAMGTYHRCAAMLEHELGVSPDAATTGVLERLLGRGREREPGVPAVPASGVSRRPGVSRAQLVGRDGEVGALLDRWGRAVRGNRGLVVVSGEAGIGKSRLVAELTEVAAAEGALIASTRCFGSSGRLPLAPVAEWLRTADLRAAADLVEPVWQREVERLVPRSGSPGPGADGSRAMVDAWQRHRFFEGLARATLASGRPTLLVLDDLQWCDEETVAWLTFLLGFAEHARLLVAATVRAEELEENRGLQLALRALRAAGLVTEIALAPLGAAQTRELAESVRGRPLTAAFTTFLHAATGGYPFCIVEAAGSLPDGDADGVALPAATLDAVLGYRLEQASPAAREVAGLAAAVGRDFSLDLLIEASDLDAGALVRAVDELWRRRIVREQPGGYDFTHDLVRAAAYGRVSPAQRWLLHRRLAQGLELRFAGHLDDVAAQLAEQYDRGGRPDRALAYYSRSAALAASVFANVEALRYHRRCLELVAQMSPGRARDNAELEVLNAMSAPQNALHGYSSPDLQRTLERSLALAERLGRPQATLACLVGLFCARFVQGHTAESNAFGTRALALAEAEGDPDLAGQAHFAVGGSATSLGLHASALEHFDRARELSRGSVSLMVGTRLEVHAGAWSAHAQWLLGDDERALDRCVDAVRSARAADHPYSLAVSLAYAAVTYQLLGDRGAARAAVVELRELCRRYAFAYYNEWAVIVGGWVTGGDPGVAQMRAGIARLRAQGSFARMAYWLSLLADGLVGSGRPEEARAVLDAAQAVGRLRDDVWWLPEVLRLRARLEPGPAGLALLEAAVVGAAAQHGRLEVRSRADLAARRSEAFVGVGHAPNAARTPGS